MHFAHAPILTQYKQWKRDPETITTKEQWLFFLSFGWKMGWITLAINNYPTCWGFLHYINDDVCFGPLHHLPNPFLISVASKGDKCMWTSLFNNRQPKDIYKDIYAYSFSTSASFSKHQNFQPQNLGVSQVSLVKV